MVVGAGIRLPAAKEAWMHAGNRGRHLPHLIGYDAHIAAFLDSLARWPYAMLQCALVADQMMWEPADIVFLHKFGNMMDGLSIPYMELLWPTAQETHIGADWAMLLAAALELAPRALHPLPKPLSSLSSPSAPIHSLATSPLPAAAIGGQNAAPLAGPPLLAAATMPAISVISVRTGTANPGLAKSGGIRDSVAKPTEARTAAAKRKRDESLTIIVPSSAGRGARGRGGATGRGRAVKGARGRGGRSGPGVSSQNPHGTTTLLTPKRADTDCSGRYQEAPVPYLALDSFASPLDVLARTLFSWHSDAH
jgi:hypothetical protein